MLQDICPICGKDRNYKHERDGTYLCWCYTCLVCHQTFPEDSDHDCEIKDDENGLHS